MKTVAIVCIFVLLVACDSPSARFSDLVAKRVTIGERTYSVRHTNYEVEAIRLPGGFEPKYREIRREFIHAIKVASGCKIRPRSLHRDLNVIRADLNCPGADETLRPYRPNVLDCVGYEDRFFDDLIEIECEIIPG